MIDSILPEGPNHPLSDISLSAFETAKNHRSYLVRHSICTSYVNLSTVLNQSRYIHLWYLSLYRSQLSLMVHAITRYLFDSCTNLLLPFLSVIGVIRAFQVW